MILLTIFVLILWCSICEWLLHRFVMHRPFLGIRYAYKAHHKVHHVIFKADESYQLQKEEDKKTIPMAIWNGPVIALLAGLPWLIFGYKYFLLTFVVAMCYYFCYEIIHWYMHLPRKRKVEYVWWFKKLNGHHLLHHRYQKKNYNVVLPFADWLFGTLLLRSPIKFKQCKESYCVPMFNLSKFSITFYSVT